MLIVIMFDIVNNIFHLTTLNEVIRWVIHESVPKSDSHGSPIERDQLTEAKFHIHKCTFSGQIYVL